MSELSGFKNITASFENNINALRVFGEQIGRLADEYDRAATKDFSEAVKSLVGVEEGKLQVLQVSINDKEVTVSKATKDDSGAIAESEHTFNLEQAKDLIEGSKSMKGKHYIQGDLLRQSALITLCSYVESLVADILHLYYAKRPDALSGDESKLTLSQMRELGSIEEVENFLISKRIEDVARESFEDQMSYFIDKLSVNLECLKPHMPHLVEISKRRNLFVHNKGVINKTYLKQVDSKFFNNEKDVEGKKLGVSERYLSRSLDSMYLCGILLIQQCWRKWFKEERDMADDYIGKASYDSLCEERWKLTKDIHQFSSKVAPISDVWARITTINCAIASKLTGDTGNVDKLLDKFDWSACALRFHLAIHMLKDEEEAFYDVLPRAIAAEEITEESLRDWPMFKPFLGHERFEEIVRHNFSTELREEAAAELSLEAHSQEEECEVDGKDIAEENSIQPVPQ